MVHRRKKRNYLGMVLDYSEDQVIKIDMQDYIKKIFDEIPESILKACNGTSTTPAANNFFEVQQDSPKMDPQQKDDFHSNVAKLLFLCKRGRTDIQTAVAFLCMRVQLPTNDDLHKLGCAIKYLHPTSKLVLSLCANNLHTIKLWVDAAFVVHPNMRIHTGGVMSLGAGACYATSQKQKINTKSSTKAELVGVDDTLPRMT